MSETKDIRQVIIGAVSHETEYSTHFNKNFNVDGSPSDVDLESIFNAPEDNIEDIVGYSKYCYRKHGIITRTVNIVRDFGATGITLYFPQENKRAKKAIDEYNKRIDVDQLVRDCIFELALTGNLACYDRDGMRVDIYPVNKIDVIPLIVDNKQLIAYKNDNINYGITDYGDKINKQIETAYPKEIVAGMKDGQQTIPLDPEYAYFAKINASQYEPYGMSILLPAFEDLAHKTLLKEAEKATANDIIDKIMLIKIGDDNHNPTPQLIDEYTAMLDGISGSVRLTVPHYVSAEYVEPETSAFEAEKFVEVDKDILNTLGISLSLIRGESGGNYAEGIINFSGLVRTIESIRNPIKKILEGLYRKELERQGIKAELAPKVEFKEVVIDKEAKLNLMKELFTTAGLPYRVLYEEYGMDFDAIKVIREQENKEGIEDVFSLRAQPFSGFGAGTGQTQEQDNGKSNGEGGAPTKTTTQRKTDKSSSNKQPRTGAYNTNRTAQ